MSRRVKCLPSRSTLQCLDIKDLKKMAANNATLKTYLEAENVMLKQHMQRIGIKAKDQWFNEDEAESSHNSAEHEDNSEEYEEQVHALLDDLLKSVGVNEEKACHLNLSYQRYDKFPIWETELRIRSRELRPAQDKAELDSKTYTRLVVVYADLIKHIQSILNDLDENDAAFRKEQTFHYWLKKQLVNNQAMENKLKCETEDYKQHIEIIQKLLRNFKTLPTHDKNEVHYTHRQMMEYKIGTHERTILQMERLENAKQVNIKAREKRIRERKEAEEAREAELKIWEKKRKMDARQVERMKMMTTLKKQEQRREKLKAKYDSKIKALLNQNEQSGVIRKTAECSH